MTNKKHTATRTLNPLHFEDLEPHRFEDLIRRLLYRFKDWSQIEPTGRAGSDEGYDIRAFEREELVTNAGEEGDEGTRFASGRRWQIQVKREKEITPAKLRSILQHDIDEIDPPHGYILAAATNISKRSYDVFRNEVTKRGVKEFHFWGQDYLEDQLFQPQNDEILFTFFAISLVPQRKTRYAEVKFGINNKNKMIKLLLRGNLRNDGVVDGENFVLLRDVRDTSYPYADEYSDFEKHPRWAEFRAARVNAREVILEARERYAYYDSKKNEWDFTHAVDLRRLRHGFRPPQLAEHDLRVEAFWRHLRRNVRAKLKVHGIVPFDDILVIDELGDPQNPGPHLYIDFSDTGPFRGFIPMLTHGRRESYVDEIPNLKRTSLFPNRFPALPKDRKFRSWTDLGLSDKIPSELDFLYSFDGRLNSLQEWDIVFRNRATAPLEESREITHVRESTVAAEIAGADHLKTIMVDFAERQLRDDEPVRVYETCRVILADPSKGLQTYLSSSY